MDTTLVQIFLMIVILAVYVFAKNFLMVRARTVVGWLTGVVALGAMALT